MSVLRIIFLSIIWLGIKAEACDYPFLRYSNNHTYCLTPKERCNIIKNNVTASDREVILKEHNKYRSKVASGQETTYSMPKASDMLQMVWDDELADLAQKHSSQCAFEHDCNECRRVENFDVGQNLYTRTMYPHPPTVDWPAAIAAWYDEVEFLEKPQIDSFQDGNGPPVTGHFTQLVWSKSWRVGCGYTMYKEKNKYVELHTCNYGPAGNMKNESIYKKGEPYTGCPINSCYGVSCSEPTYPGLCQISGNHEPLYESSGEHLFLCTFNNESDCARTSSDLDKWVISKTLSGSYIGIVQNGGESSTLNFTTPFKGEKAMCLTSHFRKGPHIAGQEENSVAYQIVTIPGHDFSFSLELKSFSAGFTKLSVTINWNMKSMLSYKFAVPAGAPPQYLEIKNIEVTDGQCP